MLRLLTLGGLSLVDDGVAVTGAASQRSRLALLAVLAASGAAGISRDKLLALLWPESDEERARHALKQGVYALRRDLGNENAVVGTATLCLDPAVIPSDVREFDEALARGDDLSAASLYTGPFLDGVFVKSAPEFDQWAASERSRLERAHLDAVGRLARGAEMSGDFTWAAQWWRRAAAAEPLSGRVALSLMKVLADSGDVSAAMQHARVHEAVVRGELDSAADDAVLAFAEELRRGEYVPPVRAPRADPTRAIASSPSDDAETSGSRSVDATAALLSSSDAPERPAPVVMVPAVPTSPPASRWRRRFIAAALVVAGVIGGRLLLPSLRGSASTPSSVNRIIVVATFENQTGDVKLDPLGEYAADWLARSLLEAGFEVFDSRTSSTISRMLASLGPKGTAQDRAAALAKETNAATVVTGRYYRVGDSLQFVANIVDPARGVILRAVAPLRGPADDAASLIGKLANRVTASLAASTDATAGASTTSLTEPPSVRAYEYASRAWEMFFARPGDTAAVFAELARATAVDSAYATPRLMRAYVLDVKAEWAELAKTVTALEPRRDRMGRVEREALALFESDLRGDLLGRLRASRELVRLSPGAADMELLLAVSASYLNRPQEAHDALVRASPDSGINIVSPMYWAWRAHSEHMLGHYADEFESAQQESRRFPTSPTSAMGFARSYAAMGRSAGLDSLLGRAGLSGRSPSQGVRWLALLAARELRAHGNRAASQGLFTRVAQLSRPVGSNRGELLTHALALYEAGRLADARTAYEAIGVNDGGIEVAGRLGAIAVRMGDTTAAARIEQRLAEWPAPFAFGSPSYWRAHMLALSGRRPEAIAMIHSAIAAGYRPYDLGEISLHDEGDFATLWDDPSFRELVRPRTGPANLP